MPLSACLDVIHVKWPLTPLTEEGQCFPLWLEDQNQLDCWLRTQTALTSSGEAL